MNIFKAIKKFLNDRGFTIAKYEKSLHVIVCFFGVILLTHVAGLYFVISGAIMLAIAVAKELYDARKGTGFSMPDMSFNFVGIAIGILFSI